MILKSEASIQIGKSTDVVYDAIVQQHHLTQYFINESTGDLVEGQIQQWKFAEFKIRFPVSNVKLEVNKSISFVWDPETVITISLEPFKEGHTVVKVVEDGKELNEENMKWLVSNAGGWANFLASLKAYLEYGVILRKGAYEFLGDEDMG